MNSQLNNAPTLVAVLMAYAEENQLRTGMSKEEWAERVDAAYCRMVAEEHRNLPAPDLASVTDDGDAWRKLRRAWDQQIRRYASGNQNFPLELAEAWIEALDEPYRTDCKRERAWRSGLYGAVRHDPTPEGDHDAWADVLAGVSELTRIVCDVLSDGSINENDRQKLPRLIKLTQGLEASTASLRMQAQRVLEECENNVTPIKQAK